MNARLFAMALALALPPSPSSFAQSAEDGANSRTVRVVAEGTREPVVGATILPSGAGIDRTPITSSAQGEFVLVDPPRRSESNATSNRGIDYLRITAPGFGAALVDPCSNAPWASPIRLRAGATLSGTLEGASEGDIVTASVAGDELCWPPRSGLYCLDERWRAVMTEGGRFELKDLPAQVPIEIGITSAGFAPGTVVTNRIVLRPGELRRLELDSASLSHTPPTSESTKGDWITLNGIAHDAEGTLRELPWFEYLGNSRRIRHRVGGGRAHVHHWRACNCLELEPGTSTLVARDVDGWVGMQVITVENGESGMRRPVRVEPGALLRLDASSLTSPARMRLSSGRLEFARRDLVPGVLRYEVVPVGTLLITLEVKGQSPVSRSCELRAGEITTVEL